MRSRIFQSNRLSYNNRGRNEQALRAQNQQDRQWGNELERLNQESRLNRAIVTSRMNRMNRLNRTNRTRRGNWPTQSIGLTRENWPASTRFHNQDELAQNDIDRQWLDELERIEQAYRENRISYAERARSRALANRTHAALMRQRIHNRTHRPGWWGGDENNPPDFYTEMDAIDRFLNGDESDEMNEMDEPIELIEQVVPNRSNSSNRSNEQIRQLNNNNSISFCDCYEMPRTIYYNNTLLAHIAPDTTSSISIQQYQSFKIKQNKLYLRIGEGLYSQVRTFHNLENWFAALIGKKAQVLVVPKYYDTSLCVLPYIYDTDLIEQCHNGDYIITRDLYTLVSHVTQDGVRDTRVDPRGFDWFINELRNAQEEWNNMPIEAFKEKVITLFTGAKSRNINSWTAEESRIYQLYGELYGDILAIRSDAEPQSKTVLYGWNMFIDHSGLRYHHLEQFQINRLFMNPIIQYIHPATCTIDYAIVNTIRESIETLNDFFDNSLAQMVYNMIGHELFTPLLERVREAHAVLHNVHNMLLQRA